MPVNGFCRSDSKGILDNAVVADISLPSCLPWDINPKVPSGISYLFAEILADLTAEIRTPMRLYRELGKRVKEGSFGGWGRWVGRGKTRNSSSIKFEN